MNTMTQTPTKIEIKAYAHYEYHVRTHTNWKKRFSGCFDSRAEFEKAIEEYAVDQANSHWNFNSEKDDPSEFGWRHILDVDMGNHDGPCSRVDIQPRISANFGDWHFNKEDLEMMDANDVLVALELDGDDEKPGEEILWQVANQINGIVNYLEFA